ncbi:hypothetical protein LX36DRAFT_713481 [Colletotrichum falcatum]|nr:hypothetical protein LX36DRAFT_713481 [Colletotrichum falcatum]
MANLDPKAPRQRSGIRLERLVDHEDHLAHAIIIIIVVMGLVLRLGPRRN